MAVVADGREDSAAEDTVAVGEDGKDLAGAVTVAEADMVEAAVVEK
jgi:hypothetical protein